MSQVTVKVEQSFGKNRAGDIIVGIERTAYLDRQIASGRLTVVDAESGEPKPPARSGSRDDWAEWLGLHTEIETAGKSRDELVEEWDALTVPTPDSAGDDEKLDPPLIGGEPTPPVGDSDAGES